MIWPLKSHLERWNIRVMAILNAAHGSGGSLTSFKAWELMESIGWLGMSLGGTICLLDELERMKYIESSYAKQGDSELFRRIVNLTEMGRFVVRRGTLLGTANANQTPNSTTPEATK